MFIVFVGSICQSKIQGAPSTMSLLPSSITLLLPSPAGNKKTSCKSWRQINFEKWYGLSHVLVSFFNNDLASRFAEGFRFPAVLGNETIMELGSREAPLAHCLDLDLNDQKTRHYFWKWFQVLKDKWKFKYKREKKSFELFGGLH